MNIQTLSIVVPTKGCVNNCKFCVSKMHESEYVLTYDIMSFKKRIQYAVVNDVNTCILTGTGEALQNREFLYLLDNAFNSVGNPFPNVELQTSGVLLNKDNIELLKNIGVNTISLSVSNIFDDDRNMEIIGVNDKLKFKLKDLIQNLKKHNFNVRLSINMIKDFDNILPLEIIKRCKYLGADQITFRELYHNGDDNYEQTKWVKENSCNPNTINKIEKYISGNYFNFFGIKIKIKKGKGNYLYTLPFGGKVYSIDGMSTVIDYDCMSKNTKESLKYIILRENGKLYCRWDDNGSLLF